MKAFTVLFNLALAATAMAGAVDTRALEPGFAERACGTTGAVPALGQNDCCSYKVDADGKCT
ncbi:hypothetical protein CBS470a_004022 [Colletotrichum nupharicola]|nr:hypothetical protein CBS470a_004022 [Colletotrichum nupharicola]